MSPAVTSPGPRLSTRSVTGSSDSHRSTRSLRFRMRSVTSSLTPGITSNSCSASSKRTWLTAAPGIDESSVRRRQLPRVWPKPGSSGESVNVWTFPSGSPASTSGRWMISMAVSLLGVSGVGGGRLGGLLGVELDDQLLAHRHVDLLAERQVPHRGLEIGAGHVEPRWDSPVEGVEVVAQHDHLARLRLDLDDVALVELLGRDRDSFPVHGDVAVADELAGLVATGGEVGAEHDVVDPQLE